jgi:predicted RNA methylase
MTPAATLSPAAAEALRTAEATATTITLTCGQLDRPIYVEVNKALGRIGGGGKWNRKVGGHVYPSDPRPELAALVGDDPDAEIVMPEDVDKINSFWRTPPEVVDRMLLLADVGNLPPEAQVLEPSAGDGAIADKIWLVAPRVRLSCIEPDLRRRDILRSHGHRVVAETFEEFISLALAHGVDPRFQAIIMNPPFTTREDTKAWATHVDLALDLLALGGRLVAVVPASYEFASTRQVNTLRARVEALDGYYEPLSDDAFRASGTLVRTGIIVLDRGGTV